MRSLETASAMEEQQLVLPAVSVMVSETRSGSGLVSWSASARLSESRSRWACFLEWRLVPAEPSAFLEWAQESKLAPETECRLVPVSMLAPVSTSVRPC